ncbi:MAG TPA: response regulator [Edaphocola sp.]|nr:response regulator [Edaphocola sp.]
MNVLLVDDHLMTIEGYISLLKEEIPEFAAFKAFNCEEAYHYITSVSKFDMAIIDYQIPEFEEKKLETGADIALLLRRYHPICKIMMITAYEEATIIYNIHRKVQPDALIIKNDISYTSFRECLQPEHRYLSPTAQKAIGIINNNEGLFNDVNREILLYLKLGYKLDEIGSALSLSESTIQKRVAKMRALFNVKDINGLIKEVIKQGIV